jgi:2-polyprenyl-3-methyl-5-hydroxy-6-metoxy-1,4-benzoquinol methylase
MEVSDPCYAESLLARQSRWWKRLLNVQWPYRAFLRSLDPGLTLDVGCGVGRNLETLGSQGVGVDTNETAVRLARQRGFRAFTVADFRESEWAREGSFDSLLFAHVLEHMTQAQATGVIKQWLPFLREQGRLILITPQEKGLAADATHVELMDFEVLGRLVKSVGATLVSTRSFPFPRCAGRFFKYNEFVVVARKMARGTS